MVSVHHEILGPRHVLAGKVEDVDSTSFATSAVAGFRCDFYFCQVYNQVYNIPSRRLQLCGWGDPRKPRCYNQPVDYPLIICYIAIENGHIYSVFSH